MTIEQTREYNRLRKRDQRERDRKALEAEGIVKPKKEWRECLGLGCGKLFWSQGKHNRLCRSCREKIRDVGDCSAHTVGRQAGQREAWVI